LRNAVNGDGPLVLVGFAEAASAPEVVWSLVDAGFRVAAFARKGRASALRRSRHVRIFEVRSPERDTAGALDDLAALLESLGGAPRILFPLDDTAVWLCSRRDLPGGWTLAGPAGSAATLALNKQLQTEAAGRAGFAVPATALARTTHEVRNAVATYPVILKGAECVVERDGRLLGCRTWVCGNDEELERACAEWAERVPVLVQPFIDGVGEGVFGLATPSGVRAWSGHRRLRMMNPHGSGASACVSKEVSDDAMRAVRALTEQTGWRGLFMIELLRDAAGRAWFVELNGRPWGSMALARRQGLEYPAWHVALALGMASAPENGASRGVEGLVCRNIGRELMHLMFVLRGPRSNAFPQWPSPWKAFQAVARIRPGDALYNWRRDDPAVFISDCYYTLHDNLLKGRR
jgi:predicted ATP-grasp superfamily ATP-dependent carboligase